MAWPLALCWLLTCPPEPSCGQWVGCRYYYCSGCTIDAGGGTIETHVRRYDVVVAKGLSSLIYAGVHENMCIMGRPFAIEQAYAWGIFEHIAVVRELVDVMYTPADPPYVPHAEGVALQTGYIERFWGQSVSMYDWIDTTSATAAAVATTGVTRAPRAATAAASRVATTAASPTPNTTPVRKVGSQPEPGPHVPPHPDYSWASAAAVDAWHDLKFGLRIHWGLYSEEALGPESWPLHNNAKNASFLSWYWRQPFAPKAFDADAWMAMMNGAGIRFFDLYAAAGRRTPDRRPAARD
jgi:hypothetical protein